MNWHPLPLLGSALAAAASFWTPNLAHACGGTFCDGLNPMPVDQTGEDILFIRDGDQMEVHVRIQYTGGPERFAWMVPLPAVPDVSVGTEALFLQLGAATIPSWTTTRVYEDPDDRPPPSGGGVFVPDDGDSGPDIVFEDTVGSFEVVVLQATLAAEVLEFFDANNYSFDPASEPIIQEYLDEGFLITGVKLTAGASAETIHPLVFRFDGDEPCVPIRLTRVAAQEDMGVRAYFLGQERWAPSNYAHVQLNPAAYSWDSPSLINYVGVLSLAVDEAGGHAFATDYSGPSDIVQTSSIYASSWSEPDWASLSAFEAMNALANAGFLTFNGIPPQVRLLLREYVPPPIDWDSSEDAFWYDYWRWPELIDTPAWNGPAFAADFDELVIEPGMHAVDMLEAWPTLTRLHTTLSPHEMTLDPIFHPAPDLPPVNENRNATAFVFNDFVWTRYTLPLRGNTTEEAEVCVADDGSWPGWPGLDAMPWALRIEQAPLMGPLQVVTDNEAEILALIAEHNEGSPCDATPGGDGDGDGDAGETGGEDAGATEDSGGCRVAPVGAGGLFGFALILLGLVRRRERASS